MKTHYLKYVFYLIVLISLIITPAMAAMTLSGVKYMADVTPNTTVTFPMTLSSAPNDTAADYEITVLGFGNSPDASYIGIDPSVDNGSYSARPFIALDKTNVSVSSGGNATITATIKAPAGDGGRYALINIHPKPVANSTGTSVVTAMNVPIMITLLGSNLTETGMINKININPVTDNSVMIVTSFSNTGNHHYYGAQNKISIVDIDGKETSLLATPLVTAIVPGGTVDFTQEVKGLNAGAHTVTSTIMINNGTVLDTKTNRFSVVSTSITEPTTGTPVTKPTTKSPLGSEVVIISVISAIALVAMRRRS